MYAILPLPVVSLVYCLTAVISTCYVNSFPLGELEETTMMRPCYVDEDYPAGPEINEPLPE